MFLHLVIGRGHVFARIKFPRLCETFTTFINPGGGVLVAHFELRSSEIKGTLELGNYQRIKVTLVMERRDNQSRTTRTP